MDWVIKMLGAVSGRPSITRFDIIRDPFLVVTITVLNHDPLGVAEVALPRVDKRPLTLVPPQNHLLDGNCLRRL
jgi:hypothetical protein